MAHNQLLYILNTWQDRQLLDYNFVSMFYKIFSGGWLGTCVCDARIRH